MPMRLVTRGCGCLAICLLALLVAGAGCYLFRQPLGTMAASFLIRDEPPVKADAAVVLGGDDHGDRVIKAAQLEQAGWVPIVYLSGPANLLGYESTDMRVFAGRHGFPESMFQEIHHTARSTRTEAAVVTEEMRRRGIHRILLVTSLYHTRRAYYLFHREAPDLEIHMVAAPDRDFTPGGWWKTRDGLKVFFFEWSKTFATWAGI
jgi:uncharacterized SAM-binding protein YcdF (DUF218 family)